MSQSIADQVTDAMGQVVSYGTGRAARQPFPVYGKTGTTDDFTNAWFTGCTRALCITVWMGYDKPYHRVHGQVVAHELRSSYGAPVYGGTVPAQIFSRVFSDYRALSGPPAAIGASPTAIVPITSPSPSATPTATGTRKPSPFAPPATSTPEVTPSTAPSKRGLL
jgi:membrane peptidoglycan carboxypeptidase